MCVRVFMTICIHVKLVKHSYIRICVIECAWHESVHVLCVHVSVCVNQYVCCICIVKTLPMCEHVATVKLI